MFFFNQYKCIDIGYFKFGLNTNFGMKLQENYIYDTKKWEAHLV